MASPWKFASIIAVLGVTALVVLRDGGGSRQEAVHLESSRVLDAAAAENIAGEFARVSPGELPTHPVAAVLPHHLVARSLIAELVVRLGAAKPKTIVIIGPDHKNSGPTYGTISSNDWAAGTRRFRIDPSVSAALDTIEDVSVSESVISEEHSVLNPLPFLAQQFPDARYVLLTFRGKFDFRGIQEVAKILNDTLGPDDLVIASVDFSHYLPLAQAEQEDVISRTVLLANDPEKLEHIPADSPSSLAVAMAFAKLRGASNPSIINHANSALLLGDPTAPSTTSYFTVVWDQ